MSLAQRPNRARATGYGGAPFGCTPRGTRAWRRAAPAGDGCRDEAAVSGRRFPRSRSGAREREWGRVGVVGRGAVRVAGERG